MDHVKDGVEDGVKDRPKDGTHGELLARLGAAFAAAAAAGHRANAGEDGGTSNFDCATLALPSRVPAARIEEIAAAAGLCAEKRRSGAWHISLDAPTGQGNRNTRVAHAIRDALQAAGVETSMYCQMD